MAWAKKRGLRPGYGTGRSMGSFIPYLDLPDYPNLSIFALWTTGDVEVRFGFYGPPPPPFDQEVVRREWSAPPELDQLD